MERGNRPVPSAVSSVVRWLIPLCALLPLIAAHSHAQQVENEPTTWLHLNGYSYHLVAKDCNSFLYGAGLTLYSRDTGRYRTAWEGDVFADSARKLSIYGGYSAVWKFGVLNAGATAAIMYHRNFHRENRFGILPVALPFVETGVRRVKVRIYYIPPVRRASDEQIAVQLMVGLGK